ASGEPAGDALGVAVVAARRHLRAAGDGRPGGVGPFDVGVGDGHHASRRRVEEGEGAGAAGWSWPPSRTSPTTTSSTPSSTPAASATGHTGRDTGAVITCRRAAHRSRHPGPARPAPPTSAPSTAGRGPAARRSGGGARPSPPTGAAGRGDGGGTAPAGGRRWRPGRRARWRR